MSKLFHFLVNTYRKDAIEAARESAAWLADSGFRVAADLEVASQLGVSAVLNGEFANCDLCLAFGGDGTLIKAAHLCCTRSTPILGVYFGRFGFVTQASNSDIKSAVEQFVAGNAILEDRIMLKTELIRHGHPVTSLHALNEVAVQRSVTVRMLTLRVSINGAHLTTYPADGVLVSTPTGSTGYNLSAGGPIMDPAVEAFVLSAIAPHTLSARPLVLNPDSQIGIVLEGPTDAVLSADNQSHLHVLEGDQLLIGKSDYVTRLLHVRENDFLYKLANRLFWSQHVLGDKS